jgi:DNA-binding NarL/FixJ family response regulator
MKQIVIRFGLMAACLLILMQLGQYTLMTKRFSDEVFLSLFAVLFLTFGYVVSQFIQNKKPIKQDNIEPISNSLEINLKRIDELKISNREYEVLELINLGCSNQEISEKLFISESTVKSHVSSLLGKLDAKRRTQAIKKAKEMHILLD